MKKGTANSQRRCGDFDPFDKLRDRRGGNIAIILAGDMVITSRGEDLAFSALEIAIFI